MPLLLLAGGIFAGIMKLVPIAESKDPLRPLQWIIILVVWMPVTMIYGRLSTTARRRFILWRQICVELGISNTTLHKVIGTNLLPWIRKQPLNYPSRNNKSSHDDLENDK
jgi:hypothetical protein